MKENEERNLSGSVGIGSKLELGQDREGWLFNVLFHCCGVGQSIFRCF